ncbi:MAG TPA: class I tRNA ligase family protein, partial [Longimicrobiales bacterium]|nr:class I tRNA ligase family protein [Longimicrobiales bacterium]
LELIKPRMQADAGSASRRAAHATLVQALDGAMRLLHPIMPFITEAIWRRLPLPDGARTTASLVVAEWPEPRGQDDEAETRMNALMELIGTVRTLRSEYNVPAASMVRIRLTNVSPPLRDALGIEERAVRRLARVDAIFTDAVDGAPEAGAHAVLKGGTDLFVPLSGIIDVDRERQRLDRERQRLESQLQITEARLSSDRFTSRAPAEIVEREQEKAASLRDQRDRLAAKLHGLG